MTVDAADLSAELDAVLRLPADERVAPLARIAQRLLDTDPAPVAALRERVVNAAVGLVEEGVGGSQHRLELGEALGSLGDPRLKLPSDADYWVEVPTDDGRIRLGRFPVTNHEYRKFVDAGGYQERANWSDEGWAWLQSVTDAWPERTKAEDAKPYIVPNQPVVSVSWWEAEAYARANGARMPRFDERLRVVRGEEKRPYPWGSPFGEGNANTREEVLGRPCAVGLYRHDHIPEGVFDLAGNVAEWSQDGVGGEHWYAPGGWDQPSMAAWAKAREHERADARWAGLGFRLARD